MIWLNENEIQRLTGYKQASKQCAWLSANDYRFTLSGDGKPLVPAEQFGVRSKPKTGKEPNFEAIHGAVA